MKGFLLLTTLALMVIPGAISQHYFSYGAPAAEQQQQQQVGQAHTGPTQPAKDRSIYARRASGISGVVSDVYEVFVGPSNYTYVLVFLSVCCVVRCHYWSLSKRLIILLFHRPSQPS